MLILPPPSLPVSILANGLFWILSLRVLRVFNLELLLLDSGAGAAVLGVHMALILPCRALRLDRVDALGAMADVSICMVFPSKYTGKMSMYCQVEGTKSALTSPPTINSRIPVGIS